MKRSTAMILTVATAVLCGLPSLVLICMGGLALMGTQMPEVMAQNPGSTTQDVAVGAGTFLCFGVVLLLIPVIVGFFSFRMSKSEESSGSDMAPPMA